MDKHVNGRAAAPVIGESAWPINKNSSVRDVMRHLAYVHRESLEKLAAYDRGEIEHVHKKKLSRKPDRVHHECPFPMRESPTSP